MTKVWTRSHIETLIVTYQKFSCLYDPHDKYYFNRQRRYNALRHVGDELNRIGFPVTTEEIKKKVKCLRTQYTREKKEIEKSIKNGAAGEDIYKPRIWFFHLLTFLDRCMKTWPPISREQNDVSIFKMR